VKSLKIVSGTLSGMGHTSQCELAIWNETSSMGRVYSRCSIRSEPSDLPDGFYALCYGGRVVATQKWCGVWLLDYLCKEDALSEPQLLKAS